MSGDRERLPVRAFPQPQTMNGEQIISSSDYGEGGMELRDYFAAEYGPHLVDRAIAHVRATKKSSEALDNQKVAQQTATWAYQLADAMMEARKR